MKKADMIECLINHYTDGNKSAFARMLGITPQTVNSWLIRDSLDLELVYSKCDGISADWLLSCGKGEMLKTKQIVETASTKINGDLIELCKLLVANYQQRDDVMNKLVSMVKKM